MLVEMMGISAANMLAQVFVEPVNVPTRALSLLLALPVCLCIAVVYKALKLEQFKAGLFVRESALLFVTLISFLVVVALCLWGVLYLVRL